MWTDTLYTSRYFEILSFKILFPPHIYLGSGLFLRFHVYLFCVYLLLSYDLLGIFATRLVLDLFFYSRSPNRSHVLGI